MCNQTVSLISAEFEKKGITTVVIQLLREAAVAVRPPRALWVPFRHGYPLNEPDQSLKQKMVIREALSLLELKDATPPVLREYSHSADL